jgi:hypothetical protein
MLGAISGKGNVGTKFYLNHFENVIFISLIYLLIQCILVVITLQLFCLLFLFEKSI